MILRQSTAVDVLIGPFVDSANGYDAETGLSPSVKLSKNGQALGVKNDATTPVHDADGYYNCELDATDTNTVGTMVLTVAGSATALAVRHEFQVVEEAVYDAMYAASAAGPLQSTTAGRTLDVTATGAAGIDWGNVENPTTAVDLSATDIQLCDTTTTVTNDVGVNEWNGVALSSTNPLPNAAAGAAGGLPTDSSGKTSFNDLSAAQVNAEMVDVVDTDTISEIAQGVPPATPTMRQAAMLPYMALRNKLDVATSGTDTMEIHNDAGTRICQKLLTDDGSDYSEAKMTSGA